MTMKIEDCFSFFQQAATRYHSNCYDISFSIFESDTPDYLLCDITNKIAAKLHRNKHKVAEQIVSDLPFSATITADGFVKFYLWQEV